MDTCAIRTATNANATPLKLTREASDVGDNLHESLQRSVTAISVSMHVECRSAHDVVGDASRRLNGISKRLMPANGDEQA